MSRSIHFYSFTPGSTSFIKIGLRSGFHQLESSLASHSITIEIKKRKKKRYKRLTFWVYSPLEELQHALREIFLITKRVASIADVILTNF